MFKKGDIIEATYNEAQRFRYEVLDKFKEKDVEYYHLKNLTSGVTFDVSQNNADILCIKVCE